jgi:hypothetical protein
MTPLELLVFLLKFYIPAIYSLLFRAVAFGYRSKPRLALGIVMYTAYMLFVPGTLMVVLGYGQYTHIAWLVNTIASLAVLIFTTDPFGKTVFLHLAQGGMVTVMSVLVNMARTLMGFSYNMLLVVLSICSPLLFFVALRLWAKPLRFVVDHIEGNIALLLAQPVLALLMVSMIPIYPAQNFSNHPVFCTLLMIGVEMIFFLYLYTLYRNLRRISALTQEETRLALLSQEVNAYQTYVDTARQSRHDLRHHDALLLELLDKGDIDAAKVYLQAHGTLLEKDALQQFCPEPTVNAVLRIYARRAAEEHVEFTASAPLPSTLPFDAPGLGGLLSNILENALDAAKATPAPYLHFTARTEDSSLLVEVRNATAGQVHFHAEMPVSNKPGGGTGTRSMAATAKKYGGMVEFSQNGQEFCTRVILPLGEGVLAPA